MAHVKLEFEAEIRAPPPRAEPARGTRVGQRRAQNRAGEGIFGAEINVALRGTHRIAGEDHALDEAVRVILHQVTVNVGAGVALVGVGDDVLDARRLRGDGAPLAAGREARAATAAEIGFFHRGEHRFRRAHQRLGQRRVTTLLPVGGQRAGTAGGDPAEHDADPRRHLHGRARLGLALGRRGEAFAEAIDAGIVLHPLGPARRVEMAGGEAGRALTDLAGEFAVQEMVERLDLRAESVRAGRAIGLGRFRDGVHVTIAAGLCEDVPPRSC